MKIVLINTVCATGSTGKIAASLYQLAEASDMTPYFAYGRNTAPDFMRSYKIGNPLDFCSHVMVNFMRGKSGFGSKISTKKFLSWLDKINPDILHLHNLHGFFIHVGYLFDYIKAHNIAIVWTLHDCWGFTGQCAHFDFAKCEKWMIECEHCPIFRSNYPYSLFKDNSRQNYFSKREAFTHVDNLIITTPSNWLAEKVRQSFLKEYPIKVIPNGINLNVFRPYPCNRGKKNKIILGVANVWDQRKGLDTFVQLSNMFDKTYQIMLVGLTSAQKKHIERKTKGTIITMGRTRNQNELASIYSNAYVFLNPTLEDNFPTTNLEALACGTPVITYNTGGSPECITSNCGLIVEKGNITALYNAVLSLEQRMDITASSCRERALSYNQDILFQEYISLYKRIFTENLNHH